MDLLFKQVEQKQFKKVNLDSLRSGAKADIAKSFEVAVKPIKRSIKWNGPRRPESLNDVQFKERLQLKNLKYSVEQYGRDPFDEVISIAIQIGTEQGIRLRKTHPLWQELVASVEAIDAAIASQNTEAYVQQIELFNSKWNQIKSTKNFEVDASNFVSLDVNARGEVNWPNNSAPIQTKQLVDALKPAFDQAATITPKNSEAKFEDVIAGLIQAGVRLENRSMVESSFGKAARIDQTMILLQPHAPINWNIAKLGFQLIKGEIKQ
jgi:hypothetical protein